MKVLYLFNFIILILSGSCTPKEAIIEANKKFVIDINQQDKITIFFNAYHTIALETTPNNLIGQFFKTNIYIFSIKNKPPFLFLPITGNTKIKQPTKEELRESTFPFPILRSMILMCIAFHEQIRKFSNMIPTVFFKILYK